MKILSQLVAVLKAGLSFHQAERAAHLEQLSEAANSSYRYLRTLALASGGPPVSAMHRVRQVIEQQQAQLRRIEIANATPRATVKLVLWLPVAALVIGQLSGLGSLQVLLRTPIAMASVLIGAVLLAVGNYWSSRVLTKARANEFDHSILLDGMAMAMAGGLPSSIAKDLAFKHFDLNFENEPDQSTIEELDSAIEFSKDTGAGLAILLTEKADELRTQKAFTKSEMLERLSVKLLLPLGVSVLPAFALIAVAPIAIAFLTNSNER